MQITISYLVYETCETEGLYFTHFTITEVELVAAASSHKFYTQISLSFFNKKKMTIIAFQKIKLQIANTVKNNNWDLKAPRCSQSHFLLQKDGGEEKNKQLWKNINI